MSRERRPRGARKSKLSGRPTEGGSGGGRGHSNMEHYAYSAELKQASRRARRSEDRKVAGEQHLELEESEESNGPE